jgi:hypothetical protein
MEAEWSWQAGTPTSPKVLEQRLSIGIHRILAELPHLSKLELRNPVVPRRILTELLRPSYYTKNESFASAALDPRYSPDKATPSYYTKNESFASGISKVWCVCRHSPWGGLFIGVNGTSTDLEKSVWCKVVDGQPSHVVVRLSGATSTNFLHRLGLPLLV